MIKKVFYIFILLFFSTSFSSNNKIEENNIGEMKKSSYNAQELFLNNKNKIIQIQVINEKTGQKTAIGSGFLVKDNQTIATNYHVISGIIHKDNHYAEYILANEKKGRLKLLNVDIINDLAILATDKPLEEKPLELEIKIPPQGDILYAFGNPHDLGSVIIDGINNGLLKKSAQSQILFSGALNSGMSGGATLDKFGKVIGINVSFLNQGSNISFIVPSEHLEKLLKEKSAKNEKEINENIAKQISKSNELYFQEGLKNNWQQGKIENFTVPLAMSNDTRCWDASVESDKGDLMDLEQVRCISDRSIFLNHRVNLGQFAYSYSYLQSAKKISQNRFYNIYSTVYKVGEINRTIKDYDDYSCHSSFISIADKPFKSTICRQPLKNYKSPEGESIDDVHFLAASIFEENQGFIIQIEIIGVQKNLANSVIKKILEQIKWQK